MFYMTQVGILGKSVKSYRGAVIRYSPNSSVVPYFSEISPLYLIDAHFPKNSQSPVPYRRPLAVPYRHPLGVPYNGPPL